MSLKGNENLQKKHQQQQQQQQQQYVNVWYILRIDVSDAKIN